MYGCVQFYDAAVAAGIRPIIGCEVYVATRTRFDKVNRIDGNNHLVLLCKNETGYKNLIKMVSAGFLEGFYSKPRIDKDLLEAHHEGLICLSACLAGEVPQAILSGDYERAKQAALYYHNLFGPGNYYIELQDHGLEEDNVVAAAAHPPFARDRHPPCRYQRRALSAARGRQDAEHPAVHPDRQDHRRRRPHGVPDRRILCQKHRRDVRPVLDGARSLREHEQNRRQCQFDFHFGETKLPYFKAPDGLDNQVYFEKLCRDGLERRYPGRVTPELRERLDYEIGVIRKMGYTNYYLIVYDFINYAKSRGIPVGPGAVRARAAWPPTASASPTLTRSATASSLNAF